MRIAALCLVVLSVTHIDFTQARCENLWGVVVHCKQGSYQIPRIASSGSRIAAMTVLPSTEKARNGTLVCRLGEKWDAKTSNNSAQKDESYRECLLFVNLENGTYRELVTPIAPDFACQSRSGKYFAVVSSVGWRFPFACRESPSTSQQVANQSPLLGRETPNTANKKNTRSGTLFCQLFHSDTLIPLWEMRYPSSDSPGVANFERASIIKGDACFSPHLQNVEPSVYNYPTMSFCPDENCFVVLTEEFGVFVLNIDSGKQFTLLTPSDNAYPKTFLHTGGSHICVLLSDGTERSVDLSNGVVTNPQVSAFEQLPTTLHTGKSYPLFQSDAYKESIVKLSGNDLILKQCGVNVEKKISLENLGGELGITKLDISRDGRWAGISIRSARSGVEHTRFSDSGFVDRYERIDLRNARVVERVVNFDVNEANLFGDGVPTVNVADKGFVRSMGVCLDCDGGGVVYAIPIRESEE